MARNIAAMHNVEQKKAMNWFLFIAIILVGSNLRVPITSVGPLIPMIRDDLALSNTMAGFITTIPLLAFALASAFAPKVANRITMERAIFYALILLIIGFFMRSYVGVFGVFLGTAVIGVGIAFGNVLIPGFIKMKFPFQIGLVTAMYSVFMNVTSAIGSGFSVPLTFVKGMGWNGSLAFWGLLAIITAIWWGAQLKNTNSVEQPHIKTRKKNSLPMWKTSLAWSLTCFMGFQSFIFYTVLTWLPDLLLHHNYSSVEAGWVLFLLQLALFPPNFIVPILAERMKSQRFLSALGASFFFFGVLGLLVGHGFILVISAMFIGLGSGTSFSLAMMFFSLRTTSGQQAAEISGMSQSIGYLLAASGPVLFGALFDLTSGWFIPMSMLMIAAVILCIAGVQSGAARVIPSESKEIAS